MGKLALSYIDYQQDVFFDWPAGIKYKIIPKGRRVGITKGGGNAVIEDLVVKEGPLLWGDTIHANIERYFDRYIKPELKTNNIKYRWEAQNKQLTIGSQFCDFRSADNPENWEGFGYKKIFLNEAGIILKNRELYTNTVLPMLLDYPDSKLIAAGVPKGKVLKDGEEHPFYTLYKRALEKPDRYQTHTYTSYYNPLLDQQAIAELEFEMGSISPQAIRQEIYGEFIEVDAINPFLFALIESEHFTTSAVLDYSKPVMLAVDFNLIPFACLVANIYTNSQGFWLDVVSEISIPLGSIPAMGERLRTTFQSVLHSLLMTGDSLGKNRNITQADNASNYEMLRKIIGLRQNQIVVPHNPTHEVSKNDCNLLFNLSLDPRAPIHVRINPQNCPTLCSELRITQCDPQGNIIKKKRTEIAQRSDFLDCLRSLINTFCKREIERHQKANFGRLKLA